MDKVIDIEERIPSMRKKRRRKTNKKFILLVSLFLIVLLSLLYFQSPLSDVKDITINDTKLSDGAFYKNQSGLFTGQSLWGFHTEDIEKRLLKITGVKEVTVSRKFLNNVKITITEWEPIAYIEDKARYDLLLVNGDRIEANEADSLLHAPILSGFTEPDVIEQTIQQLQKMDNSFFELISELQYIEEDKIRVFMNDGYEVHAAIMSFAEKMSYYPEIIAQLPKEEKGVLDIEIGVFFKTFTDYYAELGQGEEDGEETETIE
ncbi:cell-division initiation protein [Sporosarcina newyorkensis 2681]|uniref:Cell division protein DivIB n=1 Tax=Sporosarcina newyorkensis 2681 TaxID=1027292 RepID=F9DPJ8_9BACL|nr:cell division protein FtsQ/DivIB [Sporosarcina newyorkensis]EGQ27280.1 cell-division initiation protein [Sporosarcina newyorkensis 2681]